MNRTRKRLTPAAVYAARRPRGGRPEERHAVCADSCLLERGGGAACEGACFALTPAGRAKAGAVPRPRSLADVAREYYEGGATEAGLIGTSARGGAK